MTTNNSFQPKTITVCFHVGRGGYHHNPGYKTYNSYMKTLQDIIYYCNDNAFINCEDEDGNPLPDDEWTLTDQAGNIILEGRQEIESPVGVLEWDGIYDTDIVRYIEDCTDDEIEILYEYLLHNEYMDDDIADYVCSEKRMIRLRSVTCSPTTMEFTYQHGSDIYERDTFEGMDEYDAREFLEEECFIPESIDKIIDEMKDKEWL